uniref:Uncharacterized protein n=1 Tax=Glossina brevipalpis TaxID=37001 RepID=A0A1A9X4L5_9MUSC
MFASVVATHFRRIYFNIKSQQQPQHNMSTFFKMPATSPVKEKSEKLLFGGQYTATITATTTTAKEINKRDYDDHYYQEAKQKVDRSGIAGMEQQKLKPKPQKSYNKTKEQQQQQQQLLLEYNVLSTAEELRQEKETEEDDDSQELKVEDNNDEHLVKPTRLTGSFIQQQQQSLKAKRTQEPRESVAKAREPSCEHNNVNVHKNVMSGGANVTTTNIPVANQLSIKCESERVSTGKISNKLQENQFIKNEQQKTAAIAASYSGGTDPSFNNNSILNKGKYIKFKTTTITTTTTTTTSINSTTVASCKETGSPTKSLSVAATAAASSFNKKKMVAVQEMKKNTTQNSTHLQPISATSCTTTNNRTATTTTSAENSRGLDNSEDLIYGPGIVSKLRCRYLSLALRETMEQQRLNKDQLRRTTSLNNLLDKDDDLEGQDDDDVELEEIVESVDGEIVEEGIENGNDERFESKQKELLTTVQKSSSGILKVQTHLATKSSPTYLSSNTSARIITQAPGQGVMGVGVTFTETSVINRSRHLKRGNDSMKRARSVEALLSEKSPWQLQQRTAPAQSSVTIEDKIHNARERLHQGTDHLPPKRLTSIIDDTERPPPHFVKQTLKMFEASANRRPWLSNRMNSKGEVASKVETFKNIIKEQKPIINFPKPQLTINSPTKNTKTPPMPLTKPVKTLTQDNLIAPPSRKGTPSNSEGIHIVANTSAIHPPTLPTKPQHNKTTLSECASDITLPARRKNAHKSGELKEKFTSPLSVVDSPISALSKEFAKLAVNDNQTPTMKLSDADVSKGLAANVHNKKKGFVGGVDAGGDNGGGGGGDAYQNKHENNDKEFKVTKSSEIAAKADASVKIDFSNAQHDNDDNVYVSIVAAGGASQSVVNISSLVAKEGLKSHKHPGERDSDNDIDTQQKRDVLEEHNRSDEDEAYVGHRRRITRAALDNIARAGTTQQFVFASGSPSTSSTTSSSTTSSSSSTTIVTGKQVLNTNSQQQQSPPPQQQQQPQTDTPQTMDSLRHSSTPPLTSREIEKNRINELRKTSVATNLSSNSSATSLDVVINNRSSSSSISVSVTSSIISPSTSTTSINSISNANNTSNLATTFSDNDTVISATNSPLWAMRKRRQAPPAAPAENTTMIFNFSNRKEVPDYLENDGVIFRRRRELPKPNESGFVVLGDLSVETSTDMDYDDFTMCPPSPCDVEFVNANIVIDGKSSIRQKPKEATFRVQFNDTLTSTFEYPSETSLILDESFLNDSSNYCLPHGVGSSGASSSVTGGCSVDREEFTNAYQNLHLDNSLSTTELIQQQQDQEQQQQQQQQHHHVAVDEIIQLPTTPSNFSTAASTSSPSAANSANSSTNATLASPGATKSILGNLPLVLFLY